MVTCHRCRREGEADSMVYSRFTGWHYCRDLRACDDRAATSILAQLRNTALVPAGHEDKP